jgi:hypothetical protein
VFVPRHRSRHAPDNYHVDIADNGNQPWRFADPTGTNARCVLACLSSARRDLGRNDRYRPQDSHPMQFHQPPSHAILYPIGDHCFHKVNKLSIRLRWRIFRRFTEHDWWVFRT